MESKLSVPEKELHAGSVSGVDVMDDAPCWADGYGFSLQWWENLMKETVKESAKCVKESQRKTFLLLK
jgi:hypothetical protein